MDAMFEEGGPTFVELMQQALSSTERGYDLLAPKFDKTPFRTPDAILQPMVARIGQVDSALDVCCGTGAAMRWLRGICKTRVAGIDESQGMLDEARNRLVDAPGEARVELVRGDALDMPFLEEFDVVTSVGAFGHILERDEPRFIASIHHALKPGGRFVFVTSEIPSMTEPIWWMARSFNAVMRARNAVIKPEFVMYYLTFTWPTIWRKLERAGFTTNAERGVFEGFPSAILVTATKAR